MDEWPTLDALGQRMMTHQPEQPNPVRPIVDAASAFARGGLQGLANQRGIDTPEWSRLVGGLLSGDAANMALGVINPSLTPAIRFAGKIYKAPGGTHMDALSMVPAEQRAPATLDADTRVFVTPTGAVLNRWRAQDYAVKHDLFTSDAPSWARTAPELTADVLDPVARGK